MGSNDKKGKYDAPIKKAAPIDRELFENLRKKEPEKPKK